jgi:uncharacterized protein (DUF1778 family)
MRASVDTLSFSAHRLHHKIPLEFPYKRRTVVLVDGTRERTIMSTTKTDRVEVRVARQSHEQISAAAEQVNETTSEFMRNAALDRADKILALSSRTLMSPQQFDALLTSLDVPDEAPNLAKLASQPRRFARQ